MQNPPVEAILYARLSAYATRQDLELNESLGGGVQGLVYSTNSATALKIFRRQEHFQRESAAYQRIEERELRTICGFSVPRFIGQDPQLLIIEMEIVAPPFVVDFASAGVDAPLNDYPSDIMDEWEASRKELFEEKWPVVLKIMAAFRAHGIFLSDVKPGNIVFAE